MAKFQFQGRDAKGESVSGDLEAISQSAAAGDLARRGITPIKIAELVEARKSLGKINISLFKKKVNLDELIIYCRQMYALTKAGIPIIRAMKGLADSSRSEVLKDTLYTGAKNSFLRHLDSMMKRNEHYYRLSCKN